MLNAELQSFPNGFVIWKKIILETFLNLHTKMNSRWIKDLNQKKKEKKSHRSTGRRYG